MKTKDMYLVDQHWEPEKQPRPPLCYPFVQRSLTEPFTEQDHHALAHPPLPIRTPTLIIWVAPGCIACKLNRPFFERLESQTKTFRVVRVQIPTTPDMQAQFHHVTTVPLYDVVTMDPESTSPYGKGTRLQSFRNDSRQGLSFYFNINGSV